MIVRLLDAFATTAFALAFFMVVLFLLRISEVEPTNLLLLSIGTGAVALGALSGSAAEAMRGWQARRAAR